jgi:hypothetical protein
LDVTPGGQQTHLAGRSDERCEPLIPERVGDSDVGFHEGDEAIPLLKPSKLAFSAE